MLSETSTFLNLVFCNLEDNERLALYIGERRKKILYISLDSNMDVVFLSRSPTDMLTMPGISYHQIQGNYKPAFLHALWADIDLGQHFAEFDEVNDLSPELLMEYKYNLFKKIFLSQKEYLPFGFMPSLIVDSGHGFHLWWILKPAVAWYPSIEGRVITLLKAIASNIGGDYFVTDLKFFPRLPESLNVKNRSNPHVLRLRWDLLRELGIPTGRALSYCLDDLEQAFGTKSREWLTPCNRRRN